MSFTSIVQRWFDVEKGGGLFLPDGWYGHPYNNQLSLASVEESKDTFTIVLDQKLTLRFEGLKSIIAQTNQLTLGPFEKLHFEWEDIGTGRRGSKEYQDGGVEILTGVLMEQTLKIFPRRMKEETE